VKINVLIRRTISMFVMGRQKHFKPKMSSGTVCFLFFFQ